MLNTRFDLLYHVYTEPEWTCIVVSWCAFRLSWYVNTTRINLWRVK